MSNFLFDETLHQCPRCGGSGWYLAGSAGEFIHTKCACTLQKATQQTENLITPEWVSRNIPNVEYTVPFNPEKLVAATPPHLTRRTDYAIYIRQLGGIINAVKQGRKPQHSYYVCAPKGYGKKYFAYTLMMEAHKKGLNPSPLFTLRSIADARIHFQNDFLTSLWSYGMLFVSMGQGNNRETIRTLSYLLDECEMLGKPLILLTKEPKESIHRIDPNFEYRIDGEVTRMGAYSEMLYVLLTKDFVKKGGSLQ